MFGPSYPCSKAPKCWPGAASSRHMLEVKDVKRMRPLSFALNANAWSSRAAGWVYIDVVDAYPDIGSTA